MKIRPLLSELFYVGRQKDRYEEVSARPHWEQVAVTILWFVPVAVDTVEHCTPGDGCIWRPKHVE